MTQLHVHELNHLVSDTNTEQNRLIKQLNQTVSNLVNQSVSDTITGSVAQSLSR